MTIWKDLGKKLKSVMIAHQAWKMYLRDDAGKEVSPYAAPARQSDFAGLPPAYTFVCTAEPFYCKTLTYIDNLKVAGSCHKQRGDRTL